MTHLRKMMLEELERRNYAQTTIDCYIQTVADFARYFRRPPDQLGPEHIREYQAYLFRERKLAASTVTQRLAALRFFYTRTLKKAWSVADTPYPKKTRHLPSILSPEEVAHLIDSSQTRFHRTVLTTLYGTGVRRAELTHLQIPDIDSRRMVIHIRGGKGREDRDVMLSPNLLEALREHWRGLRRKPLKNGYFRAGPGTLPTIPSLRGRCGMRASVPPSGLAFRTGFIRTRCVTIPCSELLPGNFVSALFSTSSLAVMRHSLAPSIHRDRGREFGYEVHHQ